MGKDTNIAAPTPPDPLQIAQTDAQYNRINTYTPYGNMTYSGPQLNNATLTLSPEQQAQFDLQNQITQAGLQRTLDAIPGLTNSAEPEALTNSIYQQAVALMQPQFDQQMAAAQSSLSNRGIPTDSSLYSTEIGNLQTNQNNALTNAAYQAVGAGQQRESQLFNELQALLGQEQVALPNTGSFYTPGQADVTGAYGISTGMQMNNYNTQQQAASQKASDMANLAGNLGGSAMLMSSRSFKEDHGPVTVLDKLASVPVHKWRYLHNGEIHIGPFAEDFHAAFGVGTPFTINIIDMLGVLLGAVKELNNARSRTVSA